MTIRLAAALAITAALTLQARAQQTLAGRVEEGGAAWMLGTWEGQTENGESFTQTFAWELDQHMILSSWQSPRMQTKGVILLDPLSGQVQYIASSNRGGLLKGVWAPEGDALVLTLTAISTDGETWRAAVSHRRIDAETMQVEFYPIGDDGTRESTAAMSTQLKKKAAEPAPAR